MWEGRWIIGPGPSMVLADDWVDHQHHHHQDYITLAHIGGSAILGHISLGFTASSVLDKVSISTGIVAGRRRIIDQVSASAMYGPG